MQSISTIGLDVAKSVLRRGLRAPSRCFTEPNELKSIRDSVHRWMKEGAQVSSSKWLRPRLIRATPLSEAPQSTALHLIVRPGRSTPIS